MVSGMPRQIKVGDTVFVPWGLNAPVKAKIVEIWGDPPAHVRVQLAFDEDDVDSDPVVLLLSPSALQAA
jgi:hypothetical protein